MSINVNVTGNPVSINRGKYVSGEDHSTKEFDRRRKLRLEQVRQQSKDIAENVRKRVRKEKEKQLSEFEKKSERELKKWQTKKLLALQQQYQECVKEIGSGHTRAMLEPNADEFLALQRKHNEEIANERGIIAEQEEQIKKNENNYKKALPIQQKKFSRVVEDTRSKLVTGISKSKVNSPDKTTEKKREKKYTTDIDISRRLADTESSSEDEINISSNSSETIEERSPKKKICRQKCDETCPNQSTVFTDDSLCETTGKDDVLISPRKRQMEESKKPLRPQNELPISCNESPRNSNLYLNYPFETRISDRIKNRPKPPDPIFPFYNCKSKEFQYPSKVDIGIDAPSFETNEVDREKHSLDTHIKESKTIGSQTSLSEIKNPKKTMEIPAKPTVSLTGLKTVETSKKSGRVNSGLVSSKRSSKHSQGFESQLNSGNTKVFHYDHTNRFSKYSPSEQPILGKIDEKDIVVLESDENEIIKQRQKLMDQRDKDAILRGQRALEKDKVHRDYRNMLSSLTNLQKQERLASIAEHPQRYHMSEERLKEKYMQQQNKMENAYEQVIEQKRRVVTLKPVNEEPCCLNPSAPPFEIKSLNGRQSEEGCINLPPCWDINFKNVCNGESSQKEDLRTKSLLEMLERINFQRMLLEQEMSTLPKGSNLHNIPGVEEMDKNKKSVGTSVTKLPKKKLSSTVRDAKRKVSSSSSEFDTTNNDISNENIIPESKTKREKIIKDKVLQKHKKVKKGNELVLKTEGTQTSPLPKDKVNKQVQSTAVEDKPTQVESNANASGAPIIKVASTSRPVKETSSEDNLCEIVIKIKDDRSDGTKIVVNPGADLKNIKSNDLLKVRTTESKQRVKATISKENVFKEKSQQTSDDKMKTQQVVDKLEKKRIDTVDKSTATKRKGHSLSWKEQFSKNSTEMSHTTSSSTSYYSPPEPVSNRNSRETSNNSAVNTKKAREILLNLLKNRPKQSNVRPCDSSAETNTQSEQEQSYEKNISANIRTYVKALLSMSRGSIDNLGVSTGSEISTPGASVIETEANNPLLPNILELLNINQSELHYLMNVSSATSSSSSSGQYVSVENLTLTSTSTCSINLRDKSSKIEKEKSVGGKDAPMSITLERDDLKTEESQGTSNTLCSDYPVLVTKYTELADKCSQRISNLTAMIEKVREEKIKLMQTSSSSSDKEHSTTYLDLPSALTKPQTDDEHTKKADNLESKDVQNKPARLSDEEFLNKCLLEIDMSFAEKLKVESNLKSILKQAEQTTSIHQESSTKENISSENKSQIQETEPKSEESNFVPLLQDIPKYSPPVDHRQESNANAEMFANLFPPNFLPTRPKPPAAIIHSAMRHNLEMDVAPHELSTIPEIDTIVGSRNVSARNEASISDTPVETREKQVTFQKENELGKGNGVSNTKEKSKSDAKQGHALQKSERSKNIVDMFENSTQPGKCECTPRDEPDKALPKGSTKTTTLAVTKKAVRDPAVEKKTVRELTSSDSSDRERSQDVEMEAMLRSMGMGWAVATLRKTQEALALTSSSSSLDISIKQTSVKMSESSSSSETSLRDILHKHLLDKFSTEGSINASLLLKELCYCSPGQSSSQGKDKTHQRTSTPVQGASKSGGSADSQNQLAIFPVDSDISSVKHNSDDTLFLTIPTDSEKSQNKSN